jgi:hypothetical protein
MPFSIANTARDCVDKISSLTFFLAANMMPAMPTIMAITSKELIYRVKRFLRLIISPHYGLKMLIKKN